MLRAWMCECVCVCEFVCAWLKWIVLEHSTSVRYSHRARNTILFEHKSVNLPTQMPTPRRPFGEQRCWICNNYKKMYAKQRKSIYCNNSGMKNQLMFTVWHKCTVWDTEGDSCSCGWIKTQLSVSLLRLMEIEIVLAP